MSFPPLRSLRPASILLPVLALSALLCGCQIEITTDFGDGSSGQTSKTQTTTTTAPVSPGNSTPKTARVMSYNIQNFNTKAADFPLRIQRLKQIINEINPDVVAVQEMDDRAAMALIFDPAQWQIIIDDDSKDRQDLAFAIKKPWRATNIPTDLDADDEHFLAPDRALESFFPIRRDALFVKVASPDGRPAFTAINVHAKARVGGRNTTEPRRVGASRYLVSAFKKQLPGDRLVLLGDFNDAPDDISLNILETGDPNAIAGSNPWPAPHLVNLFQPLWEQGMVSSGADAQRLDGNSGMLNITYPTAPKRNAGGRGKDTHTGPILFDQILVSPELTTGSRPSSGAIYRKPLALQGPGFNRPSDHLPVYADIAIPSAAR